MEAKDIVKGMPVSKEVAIILQQKARTNEIFDHMDEVLDVMYVEEEDREWYIATVGEHLAEISEILNRFLLDAIEEQLASKPLTA